MKKYRNVAIDRCRQCTREDHEHWVEEYDRDREHYRSENTSGRQGHKRRFQENRKQKAA